MPLSASSPRAHWRAPLRSVLASVAGLLLLLLLGLPSDAQAYPWMIRHHYASCGSCHVDPSGGGLVTEYGRAQSELLVAAGGQAAAEKGEVSRSTGFLFGAVMPPQWLNMAFSFRGGAIATRSASATSVFPVQMVSDLRASATFGPVRASGTVGFAMRRAQAASLTPWEANNVVSREHWLGVDAADQTLLFRVGRIVLPFGLRNVEHNSWVRSSTRTDLNDSQQHGLAVAYNVEGLRAEVMGFVGNLQLNPSYYREQGYAGYAELTLAPNAALGVSSLMAQSRYDVATREPYLLRQAHGLFGRWAPVGPLVLMGEVDALSERAQGGDRRLGLTGLLQADVEPVQGLHLIATSELLSQQPRAQLPGTRGVGGWLSVAWFFNPHAELRVDSILRRTATDGPAQNSLTLLGQLHLTL